MQQVIRFLSNIELIIYFILGFIAILYMRRLLIALKELRGSVFGLEKEAAQRKVVSAVTVLVLVGFFTLGEFIVVTFLLPELPQQPSYATPTIDVLATDTATPPSPETAGEETVQETYPQTEVSGVSSTCIADVLEFTYPEAGDSVSGVVELTGTVNIENFGSYKYEYSTTGEINWITVAAGGEIRIEDSLGFWYTTSLTPGDYLLRLVALDNQGIELPPCVINVKVIATED